MSPRYRISPKGPQKLTDAEIGAHKDGRGLFYNYHKAVKPLYKQPCYRDPRAFLALLISGLPVTGSASVEMNTVSSRSG